MPAQAAPRSITRVVSKLGGLAVQGSDVIVCHKQPPQLHARLVSGHDADKRPPKDAAKDQETESAAVIEGESMRLTRRTNEIVGEDDESAARRLARQPDVLPIVLISACFRLVVCFRTAF